MPGRDSGHLLFMQILWAAYLVSASTINNCSTVFHQFMKKYLLSLVAIVAISSVSIAQQKVAEYQSVYFEKTYDINALKDKSDDENFTYYAEVPSSEDKKVMMILESKNMPQFVDYMTFVKGIYAKWNQTAKVNNVTELEKDIEAKPLHCESGFMYGEWNFDFDVYLEPRVKIVRGKMLLIVQSGELQSSSNQFMKHKGFNLVFSSPEEVDTFITKFDVKKVQTMFAQKSKTADLFKN